MPKVVPMCSAFSMAFTTAGVTVAGHQGAEAQVVIYIFVSVEVANLAALPFLYEIG